MIVAVPTSQRDNRSHLVFDEASREGVIVDPSFDAEALDHEIARLGLRPVAVLLTHGHIDHIAGIPRLRAARGLPLWIHAADAPLLGDGMLNGALLFGVAWEPLHAARLLAGGDEIAVGALRLRILHTPGHTPGGITVDVNGGEALLTGDLLFRGSVGRTDLPGGDQEALIRSLKRVVETFDDPPIHPGHGESSTLGEERRSNPFLRAWLAL
jgi:glyoxylase-like metal-dependent hydrolase (beta-lactamase superfamily II)